MPTTRAAVRSCLVALSLVASLGYVAAARADVPCGTETCPQNYTCQSEPVACPAIACAKDDPSCTPVDCSGTADTCEPLPCSSDDDCADGMACYTETTSDCSTTPACPAGQKCAEPADACTPTTVSGCVPKYLLPCQVDADCGTGFTCEAEQECSCTGSGSSADAGSASGDGGTPLPAQDGGAGDTPPPSNSPEEDAGTPEPADAGVTPPSCTCQTGSTKSCNLKTVACDADTDCPAGFTCDDNLSGACSAAANGPITCTADPPKVCTPPWAHLVSNSTLSNDARTATSGSSDGSTTGTGTAPGTPATPTNGSSESSGTTSPAKNDPAASEDNGGCSIGRAPGNVGGSFAFVALAFAAFAGTRRRRTR